MKTILATALVTLTLAVTNLASATPISFATDFTGTGPWDLASSHAWYGSYLADLHSDTPPGTNHGITHGNPSSRTMAMPHAMISFEAGSGPNLSLFVRAMNAAEMTLDSDPGKPFTAEPGEQATPGARPVMWVTEVSGSGGLAGESFSWQWNAAAY